MKTANSQEQSILLARNEILDEVIRPLATARYEVDYAWRDLEAHLPKMGHDFGGFDLTPDFQRGHVWTPEQQQHYIENVMRGVVSTSGLLIQFNCPNWENDDYQGDLPRGLQCIDGLQRYTAVQAFVRGDVKPFGLTNEDLAGSSYSLRRNRFLLKVAVHDFQSKVDLLQHYLDLNAGGTPHSSAELDRVREMLAEVKEKAASAKLKGMRP